MTPNCDKLKKWIAPGIWEDVDGGIHVAIPQMLEFLGMENTPENHALARKVLAEHIKKIQKLLPNDEIKIIHRYDKPGQPNAETRNEPK